MSAIIYLLTNTINGDSYIGLTTRGIECRWMEHCSADRSGSAGHLHRAIRFYGRDVFTQQILEETTTEMMYERESYYINKMKSVCKYNMTAGGEGVFNPCMAVRIKMSAAKKGKPSPHKGKQQTPEAIENNRRAQLGKRLSEEHRRNIANGLRGHPCSEETRCKIRDAQKGIPKSPTSRERMRQAHLGVKRGPHSPEHRAKISKAHKRRARMKRISAPPVQIHLT